MADSCRYCGHKSRHWNVAVRHVCSLHRTGTSRFLLHHFTSDEFSLASGHEYPQCSDTPVVSRSNSINVDDPCLAPTQTLAVTDGTGAEGSRFSGDVTTSTTRSSDTDEDRLYRLRLVPAATNRTSVDRPEIAGSADFDLGPPLNQVLPEQQAMCFQACSHPLSSVGYRWKERNCSSSDWLYKNAPSMAGSSSSCSSLPPFSVRGKELNRSGIDSAQPAVGHSATGITGNTADALFQKQAESLHCPTQKKQTKCHQQSSARSTAARFACSLCSLSYKRVADLNRHIKQKHWTALAVLNVSAAHEGPLNLTSKNASFNQLVDRKHRSQLYYEDSLPDLPLDLSTTSKTLKLSECGGGESSAHLFDPISDWRSSSNQTLPPLTFGDSMLNKCDTSSTSWTSNCTLSASTIPPFYANFTKFMESTYSPLWKSYFDSMTGRNAPAVDSEDKPSSDRAEGFICQSVCSNDLKQMNVDRSSVTGNVSALSGPVCAVDSNNNALNYDLAERNNVSITHGADVFRPTVTASQHTITGNDDVVLKDGRSWGQCPLCPFVCPHPLVMRRHLDVHDDSELQRTTQSRQTDTVDLSSVAASTCKSSFELGAAGRRASFFDVTGRLNSYFDHAGRASALASTATWNCRTWKSALTTGSDGSGNVNMVTDSTPGWLQACPLPTSNLTPSTASKPASWNSALMATSVGLQTTAGQGVIPFSRSLQEPGKTEDAWRARDWQLYECSRRTERSKSVKERIAEVHPACCHVTPAAITTTSWLSSVSNTMTPTRQWCSALPPTSMASLDWWRGWTPNEHLWSMFTGLQSAAVHSESAAVVEPSTPATHTPLNATDFKVTFPFFLTSACVKVEVTGKD